MPTARDNMCMGCWCPITKMVGRSKGGYRVRAECQCGAVQVEGPTWYATYEEAERVAWPLHTLTGAEQDGV